MRVAERKSGGYLTSKVIETSGGLYSLGMAVAPVTDWRFYDSICELMDYPQQNGAHARPI